jgi:hypothetical protein
MAEKRRVRLDIEEFDRVSLPAVWRLSGRHGIFEQIADDFFVDD